jgi:hypothetical protein
MILFIMINKIIRRVQMSDMRALLDIVNEAEAVDQSRRGFLGTMGKAAAGAAAIGLANKAAASGLSNDQADRATRDVKAAHLRTKTKMIEMAQAAVGAQWANMIEGMGNTERPKIPSEEDIMKILLHSPVPGTGKSLSQNLAEIAAAHREEVRRIKIDHGVKDPFVLERTWAGI